MPEIAVNIELYCETCGSGICGNGTATFRRNEPCFRIDACEKCMDRANERGFNEGYEKGYAEGLSAGIADAAAKEAL